jgi:enoyl-CoA hydratase
MSESVTSGTPSTEDDATVHARYDHNAIWIRFDRPPVNALTVAMFDRFCSIMDGVADDPRPVVLCGGRNAFSAGFDVKAPASDPSTVTASARACQAAVTDRPGPTIAAVEGAAVGVGLLIAAAADILVVSRGAKLRMPEVTLGIPSDAYLLRRFMPDYWVRRLTLLGEPCTAAEMHLDVAGAILCQPGTTEHVAQSVAARLDSIDAAYVREAKRGLLERDVRPADE